MAKKILSGLGVLMIALVGMRYSAGQTVSKPADTILVKHTANDQRRRVCGRTANYAARSAATFHNQQRVLNIRGECKRVAGARQTG